MPEQQVTLVGHGAIGRSLVQRSAALPGVRITHVVVPPHHRDATQAALPASIEACSTVPASTRLLLECAGHSALLEHVLPALERGVECAVLSVGAVSEPGMLEQLEAAARRGAAQVHLLSGAIGGVDALAAARLAGLDDVTYTGRKPPGSWSGTPAEQSFDLRALREPTVILEASAREAARLYPKNANVAATIALAGLGLDRTRVQLVADPGVTENIHEIRVRGAFGEMAITMRGQPLADNPKTSALTVLSALRFLSNRTSPVTL
ncbi:MULTISPECIES: aspartate dehydrogenase [Ramlibacter]|uniref:L-aspartate dehydrogenase n=1 Tax=Ramlibacter pinisoli TaxID=2682844 RepID=A0A6N8IVB2_9BURK|nr:aspartate dehydrogenase [Ramlibacter sp. CGMCC 1.13660]MVQ29926.1 aspartate dehydrogenase [Ramlibacter pinisoli]